MDGSFNKYWLICLLIIGIHASLIYSYGDDEYQMVENNVDNSKKVTFQSLIDSMHIHRRAKRAVTDDTSKHLSV